MLTIASKTATRDCQGNTRRDFLKAGVLGLGGLTLPWLLEQKAQAASESFVRDKAVVLIFLAGGASHIETFNPNVGAAAPYCSVTGEVQTTVPGLTLGGNFPRLAQHARNMAVVRSFRHPIGNHEQAISHVLTGGTDTNGQAQLGHSIGGMYARLRGTNHADTGMPTYALLTHPHTDPQYSRELQRVAVGSRGGTLGPTFNPFNPSGGGTTLENMLLNIPPERLTDRRSLLQELDRIRRGIDTPPRPPFSRGGNLIAPPLEKGGLGGRERLGEFEQQAVDLLLGGAGRALDLSREDRRVVSAYDTSMYLCGKRNFDPSLLGQQMLLARRLIEAGAGFITVQSAGWDNHADGNNPGIVDGMNMLGPPLDKALSAFLSDLEARGLSDKVLTIVTGDFGRTPTINRNGGRDHWANLCTLALFGGGLRMGQVIGQSDRQNRVPATTPISPGNLLSTIMHTVFDVGQLRITRGVPSTLLRLIEDHRPIVELFS